MFQQLRKILNIDTLEDKLISYKNSKEEINILKSSLDELASEYQEASQTYINNKSQLQTEIKKGNDESSRLWSRIDNRFQSYLKTYINNLSEIKKSIDKEQSNLNDLLKDEQLYSLIQKSEKLEAFEVIKQGFRKGLVSRDLFHKAQLEVEEYLEKGKHKEQVIVHTEHGNYVSTRLVNDEKIESNVKQGSKEEANTTGTVKTLPTSTIQDNIGGCPETYRGEQRKTWQLNKLREVAEKDGFLQQSLEELRSGVKKRINGTEAEVLFSVNGNEIDTLKAIYPLRHLSPQEDLDNFVSRIQLYNQYFPETSLEFKGVSDSKNGSTLLFSQRFVDGDILLPKKKSMYESNSEAKARLKEEDKLFKEVAKELKKRFNFQPVPGDKTKYTDSKVVISDVHLGNVMKGVDNKLYFIDLDIAPVSEIKKSEDIDLIKGKTKYSDCIIRNSEGKILFLKRSPNNDFEPNKLCFPGGHIDLGETPQEAAIRECQEETGLKVKDCWLVDQFEDDKYHIYYYECTVDNEFINPFHSEDLPIVLTNSEHLNYCWLDKDEWKTEDLLIGLKDKLNQMFVNDIEKQAIEVILKAVEEGKLDSCYIDKINNSTQNRFIMEEGDIEIISQPTDNDKSVEKES